MGIRTRVTAIAVFAAVFVSTGRADDAFSRPDSGLVIPAAGSQIVSQVAMTTDAPDGTTWVLVAPYGWLPAMRGTVGAGAATANIDLSLSDVVQQLENLNGAVMAHVEVGRNNWGLIFDGMLMQLEPKENLPGGGSVKLESSSTLLEGLSMLRLVDTEDMDLPLPRTRIDALGGARYYQVMSGVRINPAVGPLIDRELTKDWVDLVVGSRASVTVAEGLDGFIRADFGGFGIGTSSRLTWNLIAGGEYACPSHPGSSLVLGYRILSIDETQGSGADKFVYDVTLQGPFAAIAFRF